MLVIIAREDLSVYVCDRPILKTLEPDVVTSRYRLRTPDVMSIYGNPAPMAYQELTKLFYTNIYIIIFSEEK